MDAYKAIMHRKCGKGGVACYCCNDYRGKSKRKLNRLARRELNRNLDTQSQ